MEISNEARRFLSRRGLFATVATINPDGSPHQAVLWYALTDDGFLINAKEGRRWPENLRRDPRLSLVVEDGYTWVGASGTVERIDEPAATQEHIAALARRYHADEPDVAEEMVNDFQRQRRVSFLLRPERLQLHIDD